MRRFASFLAVAAALGAMCAGYAGAQSPIKPNQRFAGLVNDSRGTAVIRMACFGPIMPGQTGHPFAGQTVAVTRSHKAGAGFTGQAVSIKARLYTSSSTTRSPIRLALFYRYDQPAPISTELSFPCAGTGSVEFKPINGGPDARSAVVTVYFEGQP
jgi:hypothetical protein